MGLKVTEGGGGGDFTPVPAGVHIGVCNQVIDLGTHDNTYQGETKKRHEVYIGWQIPALLIDVEVDGKQEKHTMEIGNFYTMSLNAKAKLRKHLDAWRGRDFTKEELDGFELFSIIGAACQLQVTNTTAQDGKVKAKVETIMALPAGVPKPELVGDAVTYSLDDGGEIGAGVKQGLAKIISTSFEWQAMCRAEGTTDTTTGVEQVPTQAEVDAVPEADLPF